MSKDKKEAILNECHWRFVKEKGISSIHTKEFPSAYSEQAQLAMEAYAKEKAIAFDRFKRINLYTIDTDMEHYIKLIIDGDNARTERYSFSDVYAQFIESQNK